MKLYRDTWGWQTQGHTTAHKVTHTDEPNLSISKNIETHITLETHRHGHQETYRDTCAHQVRVPEIYTESWGFSMAPYQMFRDQE